MSEDERKQDIWIVTDGHAEAHVLKFAEEYERGRVTVSEMHSQQFRVTFEGLNNIVKEVEL